MNLLGFRLFALALVLTPVMAPGQSPAPGPASTPAASSGALLVKTGQQIVFLGDSTTQSGWTSGSGFIHLVSLGLEKESLEVRVSEFGVRGNQPKDLLDLYQKNVATLNPKPDWLVVSCGLDEVSAGLPGSDLATFQQDMKSLVEEAKAAGQQVMILTTSLAFEPDNPFDQKMAPYNDALRALAKSENCLLADVNAAEKAALPNLPPAEGNNRLLLGQATLNTHGQRLVASEILKALGATPAQMAEIGDVWLDAPRSAVAASNVIRVKGTALMTLRQYGGLEVLAMNEHQPLQVQLNNTYAADVIAALRSADASGDETALQNAAQALFEKDVADLLKKVPPQTPAATTTPAGTPNAATPAAGSGLLVKSGQKVAFLGDSITQFGWQRPEGYVNLVVRGLATVGVPVEPVPAGVSGNTSRDMLGRLKGSVLDKKPDWMTLSCGVNDVWHGPTGCDLETYKKNITSIVDQAQQANIQVMILTSTKIMETDTDPRQFNQKLAAYNDFLRGLAKERNLPLADLNEAEQTALKAIPADSPYQHLTVDGVHMNPHGNQMMALGILKAFGLTGAQLAQVSEHWQDEPNGASVEGDAAFMGSALITLRESDALEQLAEANKQTLTDYLTPIYVQALIEQAKADATVTDVAALQKGAQALFAQKVADLAKNTPTSPAAASTTQTPPPVSGK